MPQRFQDHHRLLNVQDDDRETGPITPGMLMTALRKCKRTSGAWTPHDHIDCEKLARVINGWLTPVEPPK